MKKLVKLTKVIVGAVALTGVALASEYRTVDGSGNHPQNAQQGAAGEKFIRKVPYAYSDGVNAPSLVDGPSARAISNEVFDQPDSIPSPHHINNLFWLWGQFVDHDIDLTLGPAPGAEELFPIVIPTGDPWFDPLGDGDKLMMLVRSGFHPDTGVDGVPREQVNGITAYHDASMVYGSDEARNAFLRDDHGKLKTSPGNLLPYNDGTFDNAGGPSTELFLAGDVRANEHVALTSFHTLFVREHNHWVKKLKRQYRYWSAEKLYQKARVIVEAEIQMVTYNEFFTLVVG